MNTIIGVLLGIGIGIVVVMLGIAVSYPMEAAAPSISDGIHIYNDEVQQINVTDRQINPYLVYAEHGDVYQVENYSIFRQLIPGWHTVDVQVPVNPDKMPRIVGVRYP